MNIGWSEVPIFIYLLQNYIFITSYFTINSLRIELQINVFEHKNKTTIYRTSNMSQLFF